MIIFSCGACGKTCRAPDDLAGCDAECGRCGSSLLVPYKRRAQWISGSLAVKIVAGIFFAPIAFGMIMFGVLVAPVFIVSIFLIAMPVLACCYMFRGRTPRVRSDS